MEWNPCIRCSCVCQRGWRCSSLSVGWRSCGPAGRGHIAPPTRAGGGSEGKRSGHLFGSHDSLLSHGCQRQRFIDRMSRALKRAGNRGNGNATARHVCRELLLLGGQLRPSSTFAPTRPSGSQTGFKSVGRIEIASFEKPTGQDAEPQLHLIEPGAMLGRKMEHMLVGRIA